MSKQEIWTAIIESTMRNLGYEYQDRELLPTSDAHGGDLGVECALYRTETIRLLDLRFRYLFTCYHRGG
jgi:hypothetical protein